jgi:hypothetical protein
MHIRCVFAVVVASLASVVGGCEIDTTRPIAAATAARVAATAIPTAARTPTAMSIILSPTSAPLQTSARSAAGRDHGEEGQLSKQALAQIRGDVERAISSPNLPGIETLLLNEVVLVGDDGVEHIQRDVAAGWLRQRAGSSLRVTVFERHHHVALLVTVVEGWSQVAPIRRGELGFSFHLYDAIGRPDDERGNWKIDTITLD